METVRRRWSDLHFAARTLCRNPSFTLVAIFTLALGIGVNSSIFSTIDAVVLRAVPFQDSDELVKIFETNPKQEVYRGIASLANFVDWQRESRDFTEIAAYHKWNYNLTGTSVPQRLEAARVTADFFSMLKVNPLQGRLIQPADARPGNDDVLVISYGLWERMFAGDPNIIGRFIELDGVPRRVIGIAPARFHFPSRQTDLWLPLAPDPEEILSREGKYLHVIGRLMKTSSRESAERNLNDIARKLALQHPDTNEGWGIQIFTLQEEETRNIRTAMWVLLAAVGFVLLIACTNLANLFLARGFSRQKEYAIRAALGASKPELFVQVLAEGFVIALAGGGLAILFSLWFLEIFSTYGPKELSALQDIHLNKSTLLFTLILSLVTSFVFATLPAYRASKMQTEKLLKERARGSTPMSSLRSLLVVAEISIAFVLLIGAGLLIQSFVRLMKVDPGFEPDQLLTLSVWLPAHRYGDLEQQVRFFGDLSSRIKSIPGVESVGAIQDLPLKQNKMALQVNIEEKPLPPGQQMEVAWRVVTPEYFRTMKIPLIYGRHFAFADEQKSLPVVIVNRAFAERFWEKGKALGERIQLEDESGRWSSIVGVVENIKQLGLDQEEGLAIYQPHAQKAINFRWMTVIVRSRENPSLLTGKIREQVSALDKDQPLYNIASMREVLNESVARPRFIMLLMSLFAGTALVLSIIGVYGLMSYNTAQIVPEIGIRMALGATRQNVLLFVLSKSMQLTTIALIAGVFGAIVLTQFTETLLFEIRPLDATTFTLAGLILGLSVLLASYLPARRAAGLNPISVLRYE